MTAGADVPPTTHVASRRASALRRASVGGVVAFLAAVALEHVLEPGLGPASHMISEYARTDSGVLTTAAFACWALSLVAAAGWLAWSGGAGPPVVRRTLVALLVVAAAGLVVTASFHTQTSAGVLPPGVRPALGGRLHDAGSGIATLALLAAALVSLRLSARPLAFRRVVGALVAIAVVGDIILLMVGSEVGGLRQRLLVGIGCAWQLRLLRVESGGE